MKAADQQLRDNLDAEEPLKPDRLNDMNMCSRNISHEDDGFQSDGDSSGNNNEHSPNVHRFNMFKHKTQCTIVTVSAIVSAVAMILAIFSVIKYSEASNELRIARENRGKICLPCDKEAIQIPDWRENNKPGECCAKLEEIISTLKKIAGEQAREEVKQAQEANIAKISSAGGENSLVRRVSAHLTIGSGPIAEDSIPWTNQDELAHIDGLSLQSGGRIKVPQAGYYFIYSQITLVETITPPKDLTVSIKHFIKSSQNGVETELLANSNIKWKAINERSYTQQTSYVSGIVLLQPDMDVFVTFNNPSLIKTNSQDSFFGLFRL